MKLWNATKKNEKSDRQLTRYRNFKSLFMGVGGSFWPESLGTRVLSGKICSHGWLVSFFTPKPLSTQDAVMFHQLVPDPLVPAGLGIYIVDGMGLCLSTNNFSKAKQLEVFYGSPYND